MTIIEITALDNGAHRNQTGTFSTIPDGWVVIPDGMETPNFPFGEVTVNDAAPPVVTSWTAGELPEPEPKPDPQPTTEERVVALLCYSGLWAGMLLPSCGTRECGRL